MKTRHQETVDLDTVEIDIALSFPSGVGFTDLIGGSASCSMRRTNADGTHTDVSGSCLIAPDGLRVTAAFAAGSLSPGMWECQVRASKSGKTKTIYRGTFEVEAGF